jgi:peptide/nickel transport system substrate-binding protein
MIRYAIGASCMAAVIAAAGTVANAGPEDDTLRWALNVVYNDKLHFTPVPDETPRFYNARWID